MLAVLVLLVVTGGIATTMMLVSTDGIQSGEALRNGEQALLFSESCLEEGMLQVIHDPTFEGKNFSIPQGDCEVVVEKNGEIYTIRATGKNTRFEKSVVVEAVLGVEKLEATSWKEE